MRRPWELKRTAGVLRKSIDDLVSLGRYRYFGVAFMEHYSVAQLFVFADPSSIKDQLKLAELDSFKSLRLCNAA